MRRVTHAAGAPLVAAIGAIAVLVVVIVVVAFASSGPGSETLPPTPGAGSDQVEINPGPPPPVGFALGAEFYYGGIGDVRSSLDTSRRVGLTTIRVPILWSSVQPSGPDDYDWTVVDRVIRDAAARGVGVLAAVIGAPAWAAADDATAPYAEPADPDAYAAFVKTVVTRYRGAVRAVEIWNEPNGTFFYTPRPDPISYTALLRSSYDAVKSVDARIPVVGASVGSAVDTDRSANPVDFVARMYRAGAAGHFDALSYHPYKYDASLADSWAERDSPGQQLADIRRLMIDHGDGRKQIWATEYGVPSARGRERHQADMVDDFLRAWRELPYGGPVYLYTDRDRESGRGAVENSFGLTRADGTPKPALDVVDRWLRAGSPPARDADVFGDRRDSAWGPVLSPVIPITRSRLLGRIYQNATIYETPQGPVAAPAPVAASALAYDSYPTAAYTDGYQDLAKGLRVWWTPGDAAHVVGDGVVSAWQPAYGRAISDETPQPGGGVRVTFERGIIEWTPEDGAVGQLN